MFIIVTVKINISSIIFTFFLLRFKFKDKAFSHFNTIKWTYLPKPKFQRIKFLNYWIQFSSYIYFAFFKQQVYVVALFYDEPFAYGILAISNC